MNGKRNRIRRNSDNGEESYKDDYESRESESDSDNQVAQNQVSQIIQNKSDEKLEEQKSEDKPKIIDNEKKLIGIRNPSIKLTKGLRLQIFNYFTHNE